VDRVYRVGYEEVGWLRKELPMPKVRKQDFDHLSAAERAVVGDPVDYDWGNAVVLPARARPETVQFSVRVERDAFESLQAISRDRRSSFSDVVREAITRYVRSGGKPALTNVQVSFRKDQGMLVQVAGGRAEIPANRRLRDPDERAVLGGEPALTS
jgi:hypothetical protein